MGDYETPISLLMTGWALGFFSSIALHYVGVYFSGAIQAGDMVRESESGR